LREATLVTIRCTNAKELMKMRKLVMAVVLAVLFVPALTSAQVSLGARLGYGLAMGDAAEDVGLSDFVNAQIPIQLDLGYQLTPAFTLGGYFSYGFGRVGDGVIFEGVPPLDEACDTDGVDCSMRVYRLGVQLDYRFVGASMAPWIGAGVGYEWVNFKLEVPGAEAKLGLKGMEFLNLQGGVDWRVGQKFWVGPFAMLSLGQYSKGSEDGEDFDIDDKAMHQWVQFGVRGRFDL
jgi:outer membrane protein